MKIIDKEISAGRVSGELLHKRVIAFIGKQKLQEALKAANEVTISQDHFPYSRQLHNILIIVKVILQKLSFSGKWKKYKTC